MKATAVILVLILFTYMPLLAREGKTYYVSEKGVDTNPGTMERPWATIDKVNSMMWRMQPGDRIALECGGTYRFSGRPLLISRDQITITSYGKGEKPILNCFQVLPDPVSECSGICSFPVNIQVYQVFQDGTYLYPSRWPDQRDLTRLGPVSNSTPNSFTDEIGLDSIDSGARIHYKSFDWDLIHATITGYTENPDGLDTLRWSQVTSTGQSRDHGYYITGITSEINEPGEWAFNARTKRLYVKLLDKKGSSVVETTFQDRAIVLKGSGISIENLEIRGASEAAIEFESSGKAYLIDNVDFTYNDCYGIYAGSGNPNQVLIRNCSFHYSWGRPIRFYRASNIAIRDNHFYVVGTASGGGDIYGNGGANQGRGSAIQVELVDGFCVENNRFEKLGANAVFLAGSTFKGRVIRNNIIRDFHLLNSDGGAIYMGGDADGNVVDFDTIQGNTIENGYGSFKGFSKGRQQRLGYPRVYGIYHDEAAGAGSDPSQKCYIADNYIDGTQTGMLLHKVRHDVIHGNVVRNVRNCINLSGSPGDSIFIFHNIFENVSDVPFFWTNWSGKKMPIPQGCDFNVWNIQPPHKSNTNLYFKTANLFGVHNYTLNEWRNYNKGKLDIHSVIQVKAYKDDGE